MNEVDVGETALLVSLSAQATVDCYLSAPRASVSYLAQESQKLETAVIDLQLRCAGEAAHAICEVVEEIEEVLRHGVRSSLWPIGVGGVKLSEQGRAEGLDR